MAKITGPAERMGWGWGRFWFDPAMLYVYYFTDRPAYEAMKAELRTNPKVYIAKYYLGEDIADTPSIILTDIYANFGVLGFPLAAVIVGLVLGWAGKALVSANRVGQLVLALFLLEKTLYMEKEFFGFVVDLLKFSPAVLLSAALLWSVPLVRNGNPSPALSPGSSR